MIRWFKFASCSLRNFTKDCTKEFPTNACLSTSWVSTRCVDEKRTKSKLIGCNFYEC